MAFLKEHLEHRSGLRIPIPIPVNESPPASAAASLSADGDVGLLGRSMSPDNGTRLLFGSFHVSESDRRFGSNVAVDEFDTAPMAADRTRSVLSMPGTQQHTELKPTLCSGSDVKPAAASRSTLVPTASEAHSNTGLASLNSSTAYAPLFEEHSGLRTATPADSSAGGGDAQAPSDQGGATDADAQDGWATVPPHRLPVQVQLCLRYAYGATTSVEEIVQAAPPPYLRLSQVRAMSVEEYGSWLEQVERAWYAKLRAMPSWSRYPKLGSEGRVAGGAAGRQQFSRGAKSAVPPPPLPPPRPSPPPQAGATAQAAAAAYGTQVPTLVHGCPTYGTQGLYPQHAVMHPMQPIAMGLVPPMAQLTVPTGPMHFAMVGHPLQQGAMRPMAATPVTLPFSPSHGSVPVPLMVAAPPMMGAVGGPYGMGGQPLHYWEAGAGSSLAFGRDYNSGGNRWDHGRQYGRQRSQVR